MQRSYKQLLEEHLSQHRQMIFLAGPRQVGKTTVSLEASTNRPQTYFNWDNEHHRALIIRGPQAVAQEAKLDEAHTSLPILLFDEIHKYRKWKQFLKGFFDTYEKKCRIIVTGSARLNVYKRGGDSLMGRYFLYRLHPLSIREVVDPSVPDHQEIRPPKEIDEADYAALLTYGGFPEPYLKRTKSFFNRWKQLRFEQLFREDIRDLSRIQELSEIQLLAEILQEEASHALNYSSLATKIKVSPPTLRRWLELLKNLYFCFTIQPWSKNISRSLIKEPKIYLWNWALIEDLGARLENFVASHLYKAVQFWTDRGLGEYHLYYLRDKEKREVDFLVTKDRKPWFLVETKASGDKGISRWLYYYQEKLKVPHAFQISFDRPYVNRNCFEFREPILVPAKTFLSQLV